MIVSKCVVVSFLPDLQMARKGVLKMNLPFQLLLPIGLAMTCVFATGIYMSQRGDGICSSDSLREAMLWGGGFIVYAVLDYFVLMS